MAEEEKSASQEAGTGTDLQAVVEQKEKDYRELQAKMTAETEARIKAEETLEAVTPYVDYDKLSGNGEPEESESEPVDSKEIDKKLEAQNRMLDGKLALIEFHSKNPDLAGYEDVVKVKLAATIRKHTRAGKVTKTQSELMAEAAAETRKFLETERQKGKTEQEATDKKNAEAGGLGSEGPTSPKEYEQGESNEDYFAGRQARLAKMKGN